LTAQAAERAVSHPEVQRVGLRLLTRYWPALGIVVLLAAVEAALDAALTLSYKFVIDDAIAPRNGRALALVLAGLVAAVVVASATAFVRDRFHSRQAAAMLNDLRSALFYRAQRLPVGFHAGRPPAEVLSRFSTDVGVLDVWLNGLTNSTLIPALSAAAGIGLLFYLLDWRLALLGTLVWPLALIAPRALAPRAARAARASRRQRAR